MIPQQNNSNAVAMMTAVNFSEMKISSNPAETLVDFSIGSGIGVTVFNPVSGIGGMLNIGEKNDGALKSALASYDIKIHHEDIGGTNSRTLSLEIGSGSSCIKIFGQAAVKV